MKKRAKLVLVIILSAAALSTAYAFKARSFIGYIGSGGVYSAVWISSECPDVRWGCLYTATNGETYQVYTLLGNSYESGNALKIGAR